MEGDLSDDDLDDDQMEQEDEDDEEEEDNELEDNSPVDIDELNMVLSLTTPKSDMNSVLSEIKKQYGIQIKKGEVDFTDLFSSLMKKSYRQK